MKADGFVAGDGDGLPEDEFVLNDDEHAAVLETAGRVEHHVALVVARLVAAPLCFHKAHLVQGYFVAHGHAQKVVLAVARDAFAVVRGVEQHFGWGQACLN